MKVFSLIFISLLFMGTTNKSIPLVYLVRPPLVATEKPPLLILLHGLGSNEKDLFSFANQLPGNFLMISVRAPFTISEGSYAWYEVNFSNGKPKINTLQEERSRLLLWDFISNLKNKHSFDTTQVYLCGFSQGAIMSYSLGLTNLTPIKGIAILSGRLLDEVKPQHAPDENLKQLRVFISHGTRDNVLDVQYAREANEYLKKKGLTPTYREYPEGHGVNAEMLKDLNSWLIAASH